MSELITPELVLLDQNLGETKFDVISKLAYAVVNASRATDYDQLYAAAEARESKTDTGIPGGIAIPHCRSAAVTEPTLAMARPNPGVSFGAKDGPADLIFFIAAPRWCRPGTPETALHAGTFADEEELHRLPA